MSDLWEVKLQGGPHDGHTVATLPCLVIVCDTCTTPHVYRFVEYHDDGTPSVAAHT